MIKLLLCFAFSTGLSLAGTKPPQVNALSNPFSDIPVEQVEEAKLKLFQKRYAVVEAGATECVRGKPDRWIDSGHPDVAKALFHPISPLSSVEMVTLKSGDTFEILNYGCESLSVGIRYIGTESTPKSNTIANRFKRASKALETVHHLLDARKGSPFDLVLDGGALEKASSDKKDHPHLGSEINVAGDGNDFEQARVTVLSSEKIHGNQMVTVILLNRGPL